MCTVHVIFRVGKIKKSMSQSLRACKEKRMKIDCDLCYLTSGQSGHKYKEHVMRYTFCAQRNTDTVGKHKEPNNNCHLTKSRAIGYDSECQLCRRRNSCNYNADDFSMETDLVNEK